MVHLDKPTKEEYYTEIARRTKVDLFPSKDPDNNNNCLYRGEGGRACALGVVLPDDVLLGHNSDGISNIFKEVVVYLPDWMSLAIAERLQLCHDSVVNRKEVKGDDQAWDADDKQGFLCDVRGVLYGGA